MQRRAIGLINRIIFEDISLAVSIDPPLRREWLIEFLTPKNIVKNYTAFRKSARRIYNVPLPLDSSGPPKWQEIEAAIRTDANTQSIDMNLTAARPFFEFVSDQRDQAYACDEETLRFAPGRRIAFGLSHYLVRGQNIVFQFPMPRASLLSDNAARVMIGLLHMAYCQNDFEGAEVEIVQLAHLKGQKTHERTPVVFTSETLGVLPRDQLTVEVSDIYFLLLDIAEGN